MTLRILIFSLSCLCALISFASARQDADSNVKLPSVPLDTLPEKIDWNVEQIGFSTLPIHPDDNQVSLEKIELGRKLFFDPILSADHTIACASCHRPDNGFANADKIAIGIGGKLGTRNVPTILNRGFGEHFSWDGKSDSLESQMLVPLTNPNELGNRNVDEVIARLRSNSDYLERFGITFGNSDSYVSEADSINASNLAKAIAAFERVLVLGNSNVDRFRNAEYTALNRDARQGMWIFESRGGCWKCHGGENFTDEDFHNTGVSFGMRGRDVGRFEMTKDEADRFKFKTPTLRGISLTAPYMHDGSIATLKEVVEFYNRGGSPDDPELDKDMQPLDLTEEEVGFLVEFLKALSQDQDAEIQKSENGQ